VSGETIIAAVIGALFGGGGIRLLARLVGPERDAQIAKYYRRVIKGLRNENTALLRRVGKLEERIVALEVGQDDPPPHLS
jgi:hypothetical protein